MSWSFAKRSRVLADGEDVAIGVLEPGDLRSSGGVPQAVFVLRKAGKAFEMHAAGGELAREPGGVGHLPAEDGERLRLEIADERGPQHDSLHVKHQGKTIFMDELKSKG